MENKSNQFEQKIDKSKDAESKLEVKPVYERESDKAVQKLLNKVAIITGGDSGIGKAVAIHFAREGADVVIVYFEENDEDAIATKKMVEEKGRTALLIKKDISDEKNCIEIVEETIKQFGKLDILINNAAVQYPQDNIEDISEEQLTKTFRTNIFSMFFLTKAALKYLKEGSSIINTSSVVAYRGNGMLLDYASTKGAIISFTRSLACSLASKKIRVNSVAPGPVWTPLVSSTFTDADPRSFGQPAEVATCYVFLAAESGSLITGQTIHPNGGDFITS